MKPKPLSLALFKRACRVIPGGVNSPVRAFKGVGGTPVFATSGKGASIQTADGQTLTDFCCSWGAVILGHAHRAVTQAACQAARNGSTFGIATLAEVEFAERLCKLVPYLQRVRLVCSGTEAVMTAIRLARGVTGRKMIIKFEGCYHGHNDGMLVAAGSGPLTAGVSAMRGVSKAVASEVFVLPYNDLKAAEKLMAAKGDQVAAIIVEPVAGNMGCVNPAPGFLQGLRTLTRKHKSLLIFDEVITGFRFHLGTYGQLCGVTPDITTLGKVIGGGYPLAAVGGSAAILDQLAPQGDIYQAGTLAGNPVAVAAGLKTLELLEQENPYPCLAQMAETLRDGLAAVAPSLSVSGFAGTFTPFFMGATPTNLTAAKRADTKAYAAWFHAMLKAGFYLPPSQFEMGFVSAAHTLRDCRRLIDATADHFKKPGGRHAS